MSVYQDTIDELYTVLNNDSYINTVRKGGLIDVDKKNDYPYSHINIIDATLGSGVIVFSCAVFIMALRDTVKPTDKDKWGENDNENTNLDNTLDAFRRFQLYLKNHSDTLQLVASEDLEAFTESHINVADGWIWRFDIEVVENEISGC